MSTFFMRASTLSGQGLGVSHSTFAPVIKSVRARQLAGVVEEMVQETPPGGMEVAQAASSAAGHAAAQASSSTAAQCSDASFDWAARVDFLLGSDGGASSGAGGAAAEFVRPPPMAEATASAQPVSPWDRVAQAFGSGRPEAIAVPMAIARALPCRSWNCGTCSAPIPTDATAFWAFDVAFCCEQHRAAAHPELGSLTFSGLRRSGSILTASEASTESAVSAMGAREREQKRGRNEGQEPDATPKVARTEVAGPIAG